MFVLLAATFVWATLAVDLVAESAARGGRALVLFGSVLMHTSPEAGTIAIAGVAALAGAGIAATAASVRGRWLEQRIAEEVDERYQEMAVRAAGWEAREDLIRWQITDLEREQGRLIAKRDELLDDMQTARRATAELRRVARRQKEAIFRVVRAADEVVIVPDGTPDETRDAIEVPDAGSSIRATPPQPHRELWARLVGRD
jgi:hypothetical protein